MVEKSQKKEETPLFRCMLLVLTNRDYRSPRRVKASLLHSSERTLFTATAATVHRSNFTSDNKLLVWDI
jgi:hypothetical protein